MRTNDASQRKCPICLLNDKLAKWECVGRTLQAKETASRKLKRADEPCNDSESLGKYE